LIFLFFGQPSDALLAPGSIPVNDYSPGIDKSIAEFLTCHAIPAAEILQFCRPAQARIVFIVTTSGIVLSVN